MRATIIAKFLLRLNSFLFLFLFFWSPVFAQVSTANVTGIVQDASSARIRDAAVKLINVQTGAENDSTTSSDGRFILPGVIPGAYTLQIEREGFATMQLNGIILNVGDTKNLLIRLKVGSVTESVNVDASGLTLNTADASVSTVVDRKFVANIPLNGRSFQDLISMTPGVVTPSPQAAGQGSSTQGDFSVNGQRTESNSFFVDGVSANINSGLTNGSSRFTITGSSGGGTALGTTQSLVSIDALQEFRVLSSTYSAEYGRTPGGQFTFLTRSGTDTVHGSLYTYWRDYVVDGNDWFLAGLFPTNSPNQPRFSQNDFGGTFGAPIILPGAYYGHDKTFVFASYEGLLLSQPPPPTFNYVPSAAVFAEAPAPLRNVLSYFPSSYGGLDINDASGRPSGLSALSLLGYSLPALVNSTSIRIDHTISPKLSMFLRYGDTPSHSQSEELLSLTNNIVRTRTLTFGVGNQLSTTKNNDFRLGFARNNSSAYTDPDPSSFCNDQFPAGTFNGAIGMSPPCNPARADVYIHIAGVGDSETSSDNVNSSLQEWNLRDSFSLEASNHFFKFGIDQRHVASTVNPAPLSVEADFFSRQAMVDNLASNIAITKSEPASPILNQFSAFAQDEWRASKALTLSMGIRWEVNPPPRGRRGMDAYTAIGDIDSPATLRLAPRGTPLWNTSWFNLAPRFGAAWMIDGQPGREMIVRAGAGVFFDTATRPALSAFDAMGFTTTSYVKNAPLPIIPAQLDFSTTPAPPSTNSTVFAFPSHLQLPFSMQWNIGLENALGKNQALTISYVAAHGDRLLQEQRKNVSQLNPSFGDVSFFPDGVTSNYQALQIKFQRSISPGVQALASYTWAHSLDYGSTDPLYPLTHGNSDLDVRHNLEAAISWDLPKPSNSLFLKYVLGSWGLDGRLIARTAFPVTLFGNLFSDPATGDRYYNGVDLIPNGPLYLYGSEYAGGRILNGGPNALNPAFSLPAGTAQGNAPRNFVRGFNAVQANVALRREMPIYDRLAAQIQVEAFNVLNHPNFGYIDPSLSHALFGQSTKMLNQSFGPAGSLYQQGGPRSVQFSFKVTF
jgi:Carboxypeptidase regulatory-like domain/TonB-dependent Receptor Plug Domain